MKKGFLGLGLLTAILFAAGLLHGQDEPRRKAPPEPRLVQVSQPITQEVTDYVDFTGRVDAMESVDLRARVTGFLVKASFKPGSTVNQGDLLFEIDPRPYQAQYDQAMAQVVLNEARLKLATVTLERDTLIMKATPGAITQAQIDKDMGDKEEAAAALKAAKAATEVHKLNLDFTKVRAPISGKIGRPLLTRGNLVIQDQTHLATIVSTDPVYVYFDVDERTALGLARMKGKGKADHDMDLPIQMRLSDEDGFPHRGKVDFVDVEVDPKAGTVRWRAVFANADDLLKPGMFARVRLPIGGPHKAMLVPEKAVMNDQGIKFLLVVNDKNVVERRKVKIGSLHGELREVTEGLTGDDWVIVTGISGLTPGETVTPKKVEKPKSEDK